MGRGQGCNRIQAILTAEQQAELVQDYLGGMKKKDLMAKWGLPHPPQLYAYLRRNDVQPNRQKRPKRKTFCHICGVVRPLPKYTPRSGWFKHATCGDPSCRSLLLVRSDLSRRWSLLEKARYSKAHVLGWSEPICDVDLQDNNGRLDTAELAALEKAFHLDVDERGEQLSPSARKSLWGRLSQVTIAVRLIASTAAETTLALPKSAPRTSFLRRFFGNTLDVSAATVLADAFDVIYLWRCSCVHQHTYVVQSIAEFPVAPGSYGVCPYCSSAALEIT